MYRTARREASTPGGVARAHLPSSQPLDSAAPMRHHGGQPTTAPLFVQTFETCPTPAIDYIRDASPPVRALLSAVRLLLSTDRPSPGSDDPTFSDLRPCRRAINLLILLWTCSQLGLNSVSWTAVCDPLLHFFRRARSHPPFARSPLPLSRIFFT